MSGNSFGKLFTVTGFGESHGLALGCIVDGCPPGLPLTEADLHTDLDRLEETKTSDKELVIVSRANGFSADYGHLDLGVGDHAIHDVYPQVSAWFDRWR